MTNNTLAVVDPVDVTIEQVTLSEAIAAVTIADETNASAGRALLHVTREAYRQVAARYVAHRADNVLPDSCKRDVSRALWMMATGSPDPVPAKERTRGERTFAQYISRLAGVATDLVFGLDGLESDDMYAAARESLKDQAASDREAKHREEANDSHLAYVAWRDALPVNESDALRLAIDVLTRDSVSESHAPAFAALVLPAGYVIRKSGE